MKNWVLGAFADEAGKTLEEQICALKENGLTYLEARNIEGRNFIDFSCKEALETKERLQDEGLSLLTIGSPFGKIQIDEPFEPHLESFKHAIELSHIVGAKFIRLFSFYIPTTIEDKESCLEEVLKRLNAFQEAAEGSGVMLCHENEKGIYGDTAKPCLTLVKNLPKLRLIFDPANFLQCSQETWEAWEMLKDYVEYLHMKDVDKQKNQVVPVGNGDGQVARILQAYRAKGGNMLTVEPHLKVFDGLSKLEGKDNTTKMDSFAYPTQRAAFDAAILALQKILPN